MPCGAHGRAAVDASGAGGHDLLRLVSPGLAFLPASLQLLVLGEPVTLVLRAMHADNNLASSFARTRIVAVDDDLHLLGRRESRNERRAPRCGSGGGKADDQFPHLVHASFPPYQRAKPAPVPQIRFDSSIATLQPARIAAVNSG